MSSSKSISGGTAAGAACLEEGIADSDLYAVLNVSPNADASEIRVAYRRALLFAHPDKGGTSEAFHSVTSAFNTLSCPASRLLYDQERNDKLQESRGKEKKRLVRNGSSAGTRTNASCAAQSRVNHSLEFLHNMLQTMGKVWRDSLISRVPVRVQKALIEFMKNAPVQGAQLLDSSKTRQQKPNSGSTRLGMTGARCNAQLDIEYLRIYTRLAPLETSIEHQLILVKVRQSIIAAHGTDSDFWSKPDAVCAIFDTVLAEHDTSVRDLGLSVYVEMRAPEHVANSIRIISPVVALIEAVTLRSRLLQARSTSWESFRKEWIDIMQHGKHTCSLTEAEARADQARRAFLEHRLARAVQNVEQALEHQDRLASKVKSRATKDVLESPRPLKRRRMNHRNIFSDCQDEGEKRATWPYLSAQRLRVHTRACAAAGASVRRR